MAVAGRSLLLPACRRDACRGGWGVRVGLCAQSLSHPRMSPARRGRALHRRAGSGQRLRCPVPRSLHRFCPIPTGGLGPLWFSHKSAWEV